MSFGCNFGGYCLSIWCACRGTYISWTCMFALLGDLCLGLWEKCETYSLFGKKPTTVVRTRSSQMPVTAKVTLQKIFNQWFFFTFHSFYTPAWLSAELWPERQQDTITDEDAHAPYDSESRAYVAKVVVAPSQQVPALQLLGWEAFGHLVVHDALHSPLAEAENVGQLELWLCAQTAGRTPKLLDLLLQRRRRIFGYDTYREKKEKRHIWDDEPKSTR